LNASVQDENQQQLLELEHQLAEVVFYLFFNRGWLEDSPYMEVAMEYSMEYSTHSGFKCGIQMGDLVVI